MTCYSSYARFGTVGASADQCCNGRHSRTDSAYIARLVSERISGATCARLVQQAQREGGANAKASLLDSGLAAHLVGAAQQSVTARPDLLAQLLETFVTGEIRRQITPAPS
jgi:hypothetical protein